MREHMPSAAGDALTAPRHSSWADVDVALEQARRRLHPRWWAGLPEAALLLVALTAILSSVAWGWLILVCISILIICGRMRPALVGAEHRYPAYGPASVSLLVSKSLALIWIIWAIWSVPEGRPLGTSFALALLTVTVVGILELLTQRMLATSMPSAGRRWASLARRPELHPALRDPVVLRATVILHPTRKMRVTQLAADLELDRDRAEAVVQDLAGQGLVTLRRKIVDGPDRLWASSMGRGQTVLEAHLAAIQRGAE